MESIIFKNTSYINTVTGCIQWDERKLKIYMSKIFCCCCFQSPSCLTLHNPMDCSMPGFPAPHHFLELFQVHVHWICDVIQLSHPSPCSFPASASFPMSQLFTSDAQSIGTSASVLPKSIQCWFPLRLTGLISLLSKGCSRVKQRTSN